MSAGYIFQIRYFTLNSQSLKETNNNDSSMISLEYFNQWKSKFNWLIRILLTDKAMYLYSRYDVSQPAHSHSLNIIL